MKVLVTGASGHIGNVLVRKLVERGEDVRILTIEGDKPDWLKELPLEVYKGDIRDKELVMQAVEGREVVFHLASIISISSYPSKELYEVNVGGTQNVIDACLAHKVRRLVYTSSVHALPDLPNNQLITEESDFNPDELLGGYAKTKATATKAVKGAVEKGLDAVICFPAGVLGPYDFRGSEAGKMIADYMYNRLGFYLEGQYNFVDVRDVVAGILLAYEKGRAGEGYMLAGETATINELMDIIRSKTPNMRSHLKVPVKLALVSSYVTEWLFSFINKKPPFTPYSIKVLQSNCNFSHQKSITELGYTYRPIQESIHDAMAWFREQEGK
ncbi:MAG: NAD-dependent epimerase/dehydratase family protein [Bacteroidia bacterium]